MIRIPGKIPILIHPLFWVMAAFIGFINSGTGTGTFVWVGVIFVSVLVHELGHALTGLAYGQKVSVNLVAIGGVTQRQGPPLKLFREFLVVFNGPLAGLLLFALSRELLLLQGESESLWTYALSVSALVNLFWTLVNLLPIQPLDGGKLLVIICEALMGFRGVRVALFISVLTAVGIGIAFFSVGAILAGALFFLLAFEGYRGWRGSMAMSEKDRDLQLQTTLKAAQADLDAGRLGEAEEKLRQVRDNVHRGFLHLASSELLADLLANQGRMEEAHEILLPLKGSLSPLGLQLLHRLAYETQRWQEAVELGSDAYQVAPSYEVALLNAIAHAAMEQVEPTVGWLRCSIQEGLPDIQRALDRQEFDPLRTEPTFQAFVASIH